MPSKAPNHQAKQSSQWPETKDGLPPKRKPYWQRRRRPAQSGPAVASPKAGDSATAKLPYPRRSHTQPLLPKDVVKAVTPALPVVEPLRATTNVDQKPFDFLSLPGELRNKIYELAFPERSFKIEWLTRGRDLTYVLWQDKSWKRTINQTATRRRRKFDLQRRIHTIPIPKLELSPGPAALLLTCRQVHQEACPLFYGSSSFGFVSLRVLRKFMQSINPIAKPAIKSLSLKYSTHGDPERTEFIPWKEMHDWKWEEMLWKTAEELSGLETLKIRLQINDVPLRLNLEAPWAAPLLAFRGRKLQDVEVTLVVKYGETDQRLKNCGQVVRKELLGAAYREESMEQKRAAKAALPKALKCLVIR